jgi:CRP/FNR family transcriptional regulator
MNNLQSGFNTQALSHAIPSSGINQSPRRGALRASQAVINTLKRDDWGISIGGHSALPCPEWRNSLPLIERFVPYYKKRLKPNDLVYTSGKKLNALFVITAGSFKVESLSPDGHVRSSDILLDGEWLGLDAISSGHHTCITTSIDFGEVWVVDYPTLLNEMANNPLLLTHMLKIFSKRLERSRDQLLSVTSRSAIGKVSDFLLRIGRDLREHGRRTDVITMPLSRNEVGDFLGVRVESVSRAFSKLEKLGLIAFSENSHRQITVPDWQALEEFVQAGNDANDSQF